MRQTTPPLTEDGYEMPFSPGVAPNLTVQDDRLSTPTRLTNRQKEYFCSAEGEQSASSYVPMSADRTDAKTVFDFDDETVACFMGRPETEEYGNQDLYLRMDKPSPEPDTPDAVQEGRQYSLRRTIHKSVLTKHDSGVYSPTVLAHTNPEYITMSPKLLVKTDIDKERQMTCGPEGTAKQAKYQDAGKCAAEYINLLPKDSSGNNT